MGKNYVGENTLKKVMNLMLGAFPSQELTEAEMKTMYDGINVGGDNVTIKIPANSHFNEKCNFIVSFTDDTEMIFKAMNSDGSVTAEMTKTQLANVNEMKVIDTETSQNYYVESLPFAADRIATGTITINLESDMGVY